ncbi:hypothetical protein, partial [Bacillus cereus]|uniref:hypothetical protein n=1 Tax=Bacillus cereus TaxID=1396 RepID=UPI003A8FA90C
YRFTAFILSFEENLAIKNAPPIVSYVSNNWGALHCRGLLFINYLSNNHFDLINASCLWTLL